MQINLEKHWYRSSLSFLVCLLIPFSYLYRFIIFCRRQCYQQGIFKVVSFPVPVIMVGNLTVGGTGKTPFVIWLAMYLKSLGYQPGIVSRGYGGKPTTQPYWVTAESSASVVGDEPLVIARRLTMPMVVCVDRVAAVNALLTFSNCNVVISDDGLQHYRLGAAIKMAMIDGVRQFGNQCLLPAGPLREPISRLNSMDLVVTQQNDLASAMSMCLMPRFFVCLRSGEQVSLKEFFQKKIHAVAGIGNPDRFFNTLRNLGYTVIPHAFPDHHVFTASDLIFNDDYPVIMTEKDAVKCQAFASDKQWYLSVEANVSEDVKDRISSLLVNTHLPRIENRVASQKKSTIAQEESV